MVKGFDTSLSDPSKIFLQYFLNFFSFQNNRLTPQKANSFIKQWIASGTNTSWIYRQFKDLIVKPKIIIRSSCPKPFYQSNPYEGDSYFGAYQNQQQIRICLNNIRNKIQLKQNLDRQLYSMYYSNIRKKQQKQLDSLKDTKQLDKDLIENLYESCKQGYKNYSFEQNTLKRVSKKCAVYLFRRRSTSNLPPDSLFRYASRLGEQYCL